MRISVPFALVLLATALLAHDATAADDPTDARGHCATSALPTVELQALLQYVAEHSKKRFLVARDVPGSVVLGTIDQKSVTFPLLLTILRNNGLATVEEAGVVSVVPDANIRQYPIPVISADDSSNPEDQWVSELIRPKFIGAAQLVPILRPLLPQYAHLAAYPDQNALLIIDRYGNLKRIATLVRGLDKPPASSPPKQP
jgi:general secretion pathway protein D